MTGTEGGASHPAPGGRTSRGRGSVAVAATLTVGVVVAIAVVAAHGFSGVSQRELVTLAAVILAGAGAQAVPGTREAGSARAIQAVLWMIAGLVLVNVAMAWISLDQWAWQAPAYFPAKVPIGLDFRAAYAAAQQFNNGPTGWPPFTILLATPYLLLGPDSAYVVHVGVLIALNLAALSMAVAVLGSRDIDELPMCGPESVTVGLLAPLFTIWLFVSDGFLFSLERGNFDAFPAFLAMLGLWSLARRPEGVWLPTIAFSLATAIKLYPGLLLLLVLWRFRRQSIVPLIVSNTVLALCAGPGNLASFISGLGGFVAADYFSAGNSSAKSFSLFVDQLYGVSLPVAVLIAVPVVVALLTAWRLWRRRDHAATALLMCVLVPVMFLVPNISNDYKLVLFAGPAVLLTGLLLRHIGRASAEPWGMLLALVLTLFFIATAPDMVWPPILSNKYPWILLFQLIVAWMGWRLPSPVLPPPDGHDNTADPGAPHEGTGRPTVARRSAT